MFEEPTSFLEMIKQYGWIFHQLSVALQRLELGFPPGLDDDFIALLAEVRKMMSECGMKSSAVYIKRLTEVYRDGGDDAVQVKGMCAILHERLTDDLVSVYFKHVPESRLYNSKEPFGPKVTVKFGRALTDIEEVGKCIALERSTAAVFHLGRVLELVMHSLAAVLGRPLPNDRQWQALLDAINGAVAGLPTSTEAERHRKSELAQAASNLYNVKLAWRNNVMHPKESYSPEEAREIYGTSCTFVRHLAEIL